ncbi:MAG: hypothetical protein D6714_14915 [Bacteroidetes bacterium]|nr:MAG: hypothetical protein D6714_14915 [Bacteroidota bacterium]
MIGSAFEHFFKKKFARFLHTQKPDTSRQKGVKRPFYPINSDGLLTFDTTHPEIALAPEVTFARTCFSSF